MNPVSIPKIITEGRFKILSEALANEQNHLRQAVFNHVSARDKLVDWWSARRSNVLEFWMSDNPQNIDFLVRLEGLVGSENVAHYRAWENGTRYLVPCRFKFQLMLMSEPRCLKRISNSRLLHFRQRITGSNSGQLPWESSFDLETTIRMIAWAN